MLNKNDRLQEPKWKSNVQWPEGQYLFGNEISTHRHHSKEAAECVCRLFELEGMHHENKIFPVKTWVSEIASQF